MDKDIEFLVIKANLITQGLFLEEENGIRITQHGKEVARERWMALAGEDRLLFGWLIKKHLVREL